MRPPDWPERFAAAVEEARGQPFAWGALDCWGFAAQVVRAIGGPNLLAGVPGYATAQAADETLARWGSSFLDAVAAYAAERGLQEVPPAFAQRGDLLMLDINRVHLAAVCGGGMALAKSKGGVMAMPIRTAVRAWAV